MPPEVLTATEPAGLSSQSMRNQKELEETSAGKNHLIAFLEYELATGQVVGVKDVIRSLKVELDEAKALLDALNEPASYSEEDVPGLKALATTVLQQFTEPTLLDVLRMPGCSSVKAAKALGKYLVDEGIIERFPRHSGKVASPVTLAQKPITAGPATTHTCVVCKGTIAGINYECPGCGARHHIGCAAALKASQGGCFACNRAIGQLPAIDEAAPSIIGIEEISRELDEILVVDEIMHKNITPLLDKVGQDLGRYVEASGMVVSLGDAVETTTAKLSKLVSATRAAAEQDRGAIMSEINELKAEMFRQFKEMREGNLDDNAIMEILRESKGNAKLLGRRVGRSIERMQARGLDEAAIQRDTERIFHVLGRLQALKEYMKQSPREMVVSMILGGITEALPGMVVKTVGYWLTDKFIERFL
nr:hypothetical protein [Candidatus Sigynarchaeota archaeon]